MNALSVGFYTDETILTYGKYKNRKLKDIPKEYLINIWKTSKGGGDTEMRVYLKDNIDRIKELHRRTRGVGSKSKASAPKNEISNQIVAFICNKRTFPTKKAALDSIVNKGGKKGKKEKPMPVRAYYHPKCSGWHLTSKSLSQYNKTIEKYKT